MKNTFKTLPFIAVITIITLGTAACASLTIVSVDWDSLTGPARVRQYFSVSTTDVTVYANYKDGSRKEVAFFSTSHNRESTGMQTVTVNVLGQGTGTFRTDVMELTAIRVDRPPTKRTYTVGERADLSGIRVMGSWRDLPDAEIPAYQITVASFDSRSAGSNRPVTINYKGKTATFPVTVTAAASASTPAPAATTPSTPPTTTTPAPATTTPQTVAPGTYKVGDTGPGGGTIFYYNANGFTVTGFGTCYYLEAAPLNTVTQKRWSTVTGNPFPVIDDAANTAAIGAGKNNTALILAGDPTAPAALACVSYNGGGKNDWFLPSIDELQELYKLRNRLGITASYRFWSSTQIASPTLFGVRTTSGGSGIAYILEDGKANSANKSFNIFLALAIRAF
ncbi:MAG: bacterial Ig-like domain-containing protein [Treponema sp.]|nr:bacterial Ig-like domain-containing protein [Treponema sp.]